jgi:hypothetical protein
VISYNQEIIPQLHTAILSPTAEVLPKAVAVLDVASLDAGSGTITAELAGSSVVGTYAAITLRDDEFSICDFQPVWVGK